jgi:dihydropteroate synthase
LRIANVVSGNRLFKSALGSNNENDNGWLSSAMKILTAVSAGGFILHQNKKNLGKALLAYALDQGVKYIKEHDLSEHIDKLKKWLNLEAEQSANNQTESGSGEA